MAFSAPSIPPFPSDLPVKDLECVSFAGLRNNSAAEKEKIYSACTADGFFLLDLTDCEQGRKFISIVDDMFALQEKFFDLDLEVKMQYVGERFLG